MWQHSILKEVPRNINALSSNKNAKIYARNILSSSQCFFFGEGVTKVLVETLTSHATLFGGKNAVPLRLPFAMCLFEYILQDSFARRVAALVMQTSDDSIAISPLCHIDGKGWHMSPIHYSVDSKTDGVLSRKANAVKMTEKQRKDQEELDVHIVGLTNISLMLFDCKNVSSESIVPDEKQNKARRKGGRLPLFEYKVLNVSMSSSTKREARDDDDSPKDHNRVHLCRGHFKDYTEEKPLFGKIVGRFWWQPCARGQGQGVVLHKYDCKHEESING